MSIRKGDVLIAGGGANVVTLYDKDSSDSSINWGYTSGINNPTSGAFAITGKDFSPYKTLICYVQDYGAIILSLQSSNLGNDGYNAVHGGLIYYSTNLYKVSVRVNAQKTAITFFGSVNNGVYDGFFLTRIEGVI